MAGQADLPHFTETKNSGHLTPLKCRKHDVEGLVVAALIWGSEFHLLFKM